MNENGDREHAITKKGEQRYDLIFPEYKKGGHVVRKVKVDPTYSEYTSGNDYICRFYMTAFIA